MTETEIHKIVKSYIKQSTEGLEIENPKCDFKSYWYDLSSKPGINEFLKDTSAIANTFGLDGIIVIGYDTKTNSYKDTNFRESKLPDTSQITDLINKKVDRLFDISIYDIIIDEHSLSIIYIPTSIDKPHVITNYQTFDKNGNLKREEQQKIFVRKGTSTYPASKNDIELMFYDRKNIIPDYKIQSSFHSKSLTLNLSPKDGILTSTISLILENSGRRPVSIIKIEMEIYIFPDATGSDIFSLETNDRYLSRPITINPANITNQQIEFFSLKFINQTTAFIHAKMHEILINSKNILTSSILLTLSNGTKITSDLVISTS